MVSMHDDFVANQIRSEFIESKDDGQQFFLGSGIIQLSIIQSPACVIDHLKDLLSFLPQLHSRLHLTLVQKEKTNLEPQR